MRAKYLFSKLVLGGGAAWNYESTNKKQNNHRGDFHAYLLCSGLWALSAPHRLCFLIVYKASCWNDQGSGSRPHSSINIQPRVHFSSRLPDGKINTFVCHQRQDNWGASYEAKSKVLNSLMLSLVRVLSDYRSHKQSTAGIFFEQKSRSNWSEGWDYWTTTQNTNFCHGHLLSLHHSRYLVVV